MWWRQSNRKALTCSPWLCVWNHPQLSWREWHWTARSHCLHTADLKKTQRQLFSTHTTVLVNEPSIHVVSENACHVVALAQRHHSLWWARNHHLSQSFIHFLPVSVRRPESKKHQTNQICCPTVVRSEILKSPHSLWYNHKKSYEVLWIQHEVILLDDVGEAPG